MIGSEIAKRYAKALFEIAREDGTIERVYEELRQYAAMVKDSDDATRFFANPVFDRVDKKAVLHKIIAKTRASTIMANFLYVLGDKMRIGLLSQIEGWYRHFLDIELNRIQVSIKTAFPLSPELSRRIGDRFREITGKTVTMSMEEDPSLIGGIVVRVGDTLYDGSISARLNGIREFIREET